MDRDIEDDEFDEYLRQKIREVIKEEFQGEEDVEQAQEAVKQDPSNQSESSTGSTDGKYTRRRFLKLAGLGAGSLALSSTAAAWFSVGDSVGGGTQTLSDVLTEGNDISGHDIVDGGTTVWDSSNTYIPTSAIQTINTSDIASDAVTGAKIASGAVGSTQISDGTIQKTDLGFTPNPVTDKDVARTFGESDLSLSLTSAIVTGESVELSGYGTTATRPDDDSTSTDVTGAYGLRINPNSDIEGVRVEISANTGPVSEVALLDSNENILAEATNGPYSAGETIDLVATLSASTTYYVSVYDSSTYDVGFHNGGGSFPYTSADVDITAVANSAHPDDGDSIGIDTANAGYAIDDVTAITGDDANSGTAYIEWPYPDDLYAWDVATFTRTLDGETVDVFVEEAQGSPGWTEVAGPISRGDSIPADASNDIRFRVELSRSNTSNNPTLDSIARRWRI